METSVYTRNDSPIALEMGGLRNLELKTSRKHEFIVESSTRFLFCRLDGCLGGSVLWTDSPRLKKDKEQQKRRNSGHNADRKSGRRQLKSKGLEGGAVWLHHQTFSPRELVRDSKAVLTSDTSRLDRLSKWGLSWSDQPASPLLDSPIKMGPNRYRFGLKIFDDPQERLIQDSAVGSSMGGSLTIEDVRWCTYTSLTKAIVHHDPWYKRTEVLATLLSKKGPYEKLFWTKHHITG